MSHPVSFIVRYPISRERQHIVDEQVTRSVKERYGAGAEQFEAALCCAVDYDPSLLKVIPDEVIERDYGCGDPSRYVRPGERVLDLGSGGGKICFIASQVVGEQGSVIGIDMTDEMLDLARRSAPKVAEAIGYANVDFRKGRIEDLATDWEKIQAYIEENPVTTLKDYEKLESYKADLRRNLPLVADGSIDTIVSNCVLNLVADSAKPGLFSEMYRVLKPGGRVAVSDIVSDVPTPAHLKADPTLWSGCISGALTEEVFLDELVRAGFRGVMIDKRDEKPWQVVEGINYRSVTVLATKPETVDLQTPSCQMIYRGPWKRVEDDDGRTFIRGRMTDVDGKGQAALSAEIYGRDIIRADRQADACCDSTPPDPEPKSCC